MFGGVGKAGWATILAGSVLLGGSISAQAADLGGDCCADLEERIAELEATTARKGNRKVSLTVYGKVNQALGWWDDGVEQNVYNFTNDTSRTRFGFKGKAKINSDWYAGYRIEIGVRTPDQGALDADNDDGGGPFDIRHSYWTLGSKTYGAIRVGETSMAHDGIQQFTTAKLSHFANQDIFDANDSFVIRGLSTGDEWGDVAYVFEPGEGSRGNVIRYESPEFGGFQALAHWGEDDIWGVALTYAGEIADFKIKGGIGYGEMTEADEECTENGTSPVASHCTEYGGSLSVMHKSTGLFATGAYGLREDDQKGFFTGDDEVTHWMVQGGIEQKWVALGPTTLFGGYQQHDAGDVPFFDDNDDLDHTLNNVEIEMYEFGANQHISAAAMDFYLHYKHYEADITGETTEPWQTVIGGAHIKF